MGVRYNPKIVTNDLMLCLDVGNTKSYSGSGTTWTDLSGLSNTGTLTNGPTFNSSNGGSLVFDGTDDYITLGTPTRLNQIQVPLTFCAWARSTNVSGLRTLWSAYKSTSSSQLYSLIRVDFGTLRYFGSTAAGSFQYQNSFTVAANIWYFYAIVISGTVSSPTVKLFLNNSSQSFSYSAFSTTPDSSVDFRIGGAQAVLNEGWIGNISNVCWYNRNLSDLEVQQNFNALRGRYGI